MKHFFVVFFIALVHLCSCTRVLPPDPHGPLPSERQLAWHEMEFYAFVHFNMNTFTNMEWGMGSEQPSQFNPTELDCRQWAKVCKEAGMKGIIITAKHHDGFCLWPSAYTEHSVKNSPWKDGKGDVVRELADACKEYGLKMGVYLSPWDRNHADYSKPEYISYFRNQLRELLTNYGDIFEVWFDGANGGTGYYGGANENRKIDRRTYYDWPNTFQMVRDLQPMAVMFSDGGPDIRWVGNEEGWARPTNWSLLKRDDFAPGVAENLEHLRAGQEDGTHWLPAEVDVSIRPGWYYHPYEDHKVKTLSQLLDIYYHSIGRNASLLLNFPVDTRGLIHENDEAAVLKLARQIEKDFAYDLAAKSKITASQTRGGCRKYKPENVNDGNPETFWATDDGVLQASLILDFGRQVPFNRFLVQEYIPLGQRVKKFSVEALVNGEWQTIADETTIGYKRILRFPTVEASLLRFSILDAKASPVISNIQVFNAPKVLEMPSVRRNQQGEMFMTVSDTGVDIFFTTDGTNPGIGAEKFTAPFYFLKKGVVKAVAVDPATGNASDVATESFDIPTVKWKLTGLLGDHLSAKHIFDGNPETALTLAHSFPVDFIIDLGEIVDVNGFSYLPDQGKRNPGVISAYEFYVSTDGRSWGSPVSSGEFSNIWNSPVLQRVAFAPHQARFLRFRALSGANEVRPPGIAEFGVFTTENQ